MRKPRPLPNLHLESVVCALQGHMMPAKNYIHLDGQHSALGLEIGDSRRLLRCVRCDSWKEVEVDPDQRDQQPEDLADLPMPRRGKILKQFVVLRLIAVDKLLHALLFALLFAVAFVVDNNLGGLQDQADALYGWLQSSEAANTPGRDFIASGIHGVMRLNHHTLQTVLLISAAYTLLEGLESWGLWFERRWAEYLTAIATAGLLPLEIHELIVRVSPLRIGALLVNLLILGWLVYAKRLFGIRGGHAAMQQIEEMQSPVDLRPLGLHMPPGET